MIKFRVKPVILREKYMIVNLKSKTKFREGKIDIYFWDNGMSKKHFYCICLSVEFVDAFFLNYCLQVIFKRMQVCF